MAAARSGDRDRRQRDRARDAAGRADASGRLVLFPSRYLDQKVTIIGQFGGRNLLGDLPDAPGNSRYDFVLRSADAAIWVSNLRPRGRDFELALDARIDTGRWVAGQRRRASRAAASSGWTRPARRSRSRSRRPRPPTDARRSACRPRRRPKWSSARRRPTKPTSRCRPTSGFSSRATSTRRRSGTASACATRDDARADGPCPPTEFTTQYLPANRVLEIRFAQPLEPFRTVADRARRGHPGHATSSRSSPGR